VLLAHRSARPAASRAFRRTRYGASPVRLVLDPGGALARYVGVSGHPAFRWLDRGGRPRGRVFHSFADVPR
jgi:hypothetical protein